MKKPTKETKKKFWKKPEMDSFYVIIDIDKKKKDPKGQEGNMKNMKEKKEGKTWET